MKKNNKIQILLQRSENSKCVDCNDPCAIRIDVDNFVFLCDKCAGIHTEVGFRILNALKDPIDEKIITNLGETSNQQFNSKYMAKWHEMSDQKIPFGAQYIERRSFILSKYVERKWFSNHPNYCYYNSQISEIQFPDKSNASSDSSPFLTSSETSQIASPLDIYPEYQFYRRDAEIENPQSVNNYEFPFLANDDILLTEEGDDNLDEGLDDNLDDDLDDELNDNALFYDIEDNANYNDGEKPKSDSRMSECESSKMSRKRTRHHSSYDYDTKMEAKSEIESENETRKREEEIMVKEKRMEKEKSIKYMQVEKEKQEKMKREEEEEKSIKYMQVEKEKQEKMKREEEKEKMERKEKIEKETKGRMRRKEKKSIQEIFSIRSKRKSCSRPRSSVCKAQNEMPMVEEAIFPEMQSDSSHLKQWRDIRENQRGKK